MDIQVLPPSLSFLFGASDPSQALEHANHMFYHWTTLPILVFCANAKILQWIFLLHIFLNTLNTESGSESELPTNTQFHQLVPEWSLNRLYQIILPL